MNWDRGIEIAILFTLWIEFVYDLMWNNHEARLKRRRKNAKKEKEVDKQGLREGTGVLLQETKRALRDMPEASKSIQAEIKP